MLFDLIQQSIEEDRANLEDRTVYFSNKKICTMIKEDQVTVLPNLNSDHEEVDTKSVALVCAANVPSEKSIMVRSPSGDIDILTLFVAHDFRDTKVFIDNGTDKNRKIIEVTSSQLSAEEKKALIGVHAFSGNDYVSSFFRKGKSAFWNLALKKHEFLQLFGKLGLEFRVNQQLFDGLEKFLRFLYGFPKKSTVSDVRKSIFWTKFDKEKKVVDLNVLPPFKNNLKYHINRSNYIAYICRHAIQLVLDIEKADNHGCDEEGEVCWSDECYPEEVSDFLPEKEHGGEDSLSDNDDSESYFEDDIDDDVEDVTDF